MQKLNLRRARGDNANEHQWFVTGIPDLVFRVAGDESNMSLFYRNPNAIAEDLSRARVKKYFMLPVVDVLGGVSVFCQFKHPHAEIPGTVIFTDQHPTRDPFYDIAVKGFCLCIRIFHDFHVVLLLKIEDVVKIRNVADVTAVLETPFASIRPDNFVLIGKNPKIKTRKRRQNFSYIFESENRQAFIFLFGRGELEIVCADSR